MSSSVGSLTISQLKEAYLDGSLSPTDAISDLINEIETRDSDIGAYISIDKESALESAKNADISKPLGGIPIAIKDLINVKGQNCSCASRILKDSYISTYDATAISKLKSNGAIPLGRVNMDVLWDHPPKIQVFILQRTHGIQVAYLEEVVEVQQHVLPMIQQLHHSVQILVAPSVNRHHSAEL